MRTKTILFALLTLAPISMSAQQSISICEQPSAGSMTLVNDMFNESSRDKIEWREEANQADMDRL